MLGYTRTITSKLQLTLPAKLVKPLGWKRGDKVAAREENGRIIVARIKDQVEKLAGSLETP